MSNNDSEIGFKSSWSSLDNTKVISLTSKSGYYSISEEGENECKLMSFSSFKSEQLYNIWDLEEVYDSLNDAINNTGSLVRAGNSKGFRIASSYFQSGDLQQITFYSDRSSYASSLKLAIYKNGTYTVKAELQYNSDSSGQLSDSEMEQFGIERQSDGTFKNSVYKHVYDFNNSSVTLDNSLLSDSTAALFVFSSSSYPLDSTLTHRDVEQNYSNFSTIRTYCCYRSLNDAISFFYDGGASAAPIYIPFFSYSIVTNVVSDHTTENFKKYHLSSENIQEMERLSYSAPFIEGIKKVNRANACFKRIYISHQTLMGNMYNDSQRPSRFSLGDKAIKKVSIPLNYGNMWVNKEHQDYYRYGLDSSAGSSNTGVNKDYGIAFLPLSLKIAVENPDTENPIWHKSINAVSQLTSLNPNNYKDWMSVETIWNFEFEEIEYKNNGIWVEIENNLKTLYPFNGGEISTNNLPYDSITELAISYYQAAYSDNNDYIRLSAPKRGYTSGSNDNQDIIIESGEIQYLEEDVNVIAPIKIYFDFGARENWYDFIDEHVYQSSLYSYKTVNPADGLTNFVNHNMSSAIINGEFVPKVASNKGFYLNAVTFLNVNNNFTNNAYTYWLLIKDGDKRYISKNGIKIRNSSRFTPTWIFDLNEKINFVTSSQIQVGLIKSSDINASFDDIKTAGVNDGGIELKCYQTTDRECVINRKGTNDSLNSQVGWVPTILFSFRCNELDDMAQRIANLENLVINLTNKS